MCIISIVSTGALVFYPLECVGSKIVDAKFTPLTDIV